MKLKSRTQLFRDLKDKTIALELIERFGDTDIPMIMRGVRKVGTVNTVGCKLISSSGKESYLDIPRSSLVDYSDDELIIYSPGYREPYEEEEEVINEWNKIANSDDYKERANIDLLTDGSSTFYQEKRFFEERNMLYLMMQDKNGKGIDYNKQNNGDREYIADPAVKGDKILVYKVHQI